MSQHSGVFQSPLFRLGIPTMTSLILVGIALLIVEDQALRIILLMTAALDFIITPQILRRSARNA